MSITAFIPVFRAPKRAADLATALLAEGFADSAVVVVVDGETTPAIAAALSPLRSEARLRVVEGLPHLGKVAALNRAVASCDSDFLLFLDNDVMPLPGTLLFEGCARVLAAADLTELPKLAEGRGFFAAMMRHEFLANLAGSLLMARMSGRCPSMNGAAFAVRRALFARLGGFMATINEDIDFAARAFLADAEFAIDPALGVMNEVPGTAGEWLRQRRRWSLNVGLWSRAYVGRFAKEKPEHAMAMALSSLLFPMPFVTAVLAVAGIAAAAAGAGAGPGTGAAGIAAGAAGVTAFIGCGLYFRSVARRFRQPFSWPGFAGFSLLYSPVWAVASTMGRIAARSRKPHDIDWKLTASDAPAPSRERE